MARKNKQLPDTLQIWIEARKRYHLSHRQIQMARELGMNPQKLGKLANHQQERRAAQILLEAVDELVVDPRDLDDEGYLDFDHYTIVKVEPGKLWLKVFKGGGHRTLGPIPTPKRATELLRRGWDISCALGRMRGQWRIVEVANVYPK